MQSTVSFELLKLLDPVEDAKKGPVSLNLA